ncbi:MAG: hypothetical protein JW841_15385 [Deltaproteobacteria bacterium]|nr:hypothetical protein [Deltaproteobacteria bacterium]
MNADSEATHSTANKPRRPWLAALLAIVSPGLGHVYSGKPYLGITISLARWFPMLIVMTLGTLLNLAK